MGFIFFSTDEVSVCLKTFVLMFNVNCCSNFYALSRCSPETMWTTTTLMLNESIYSRAVQLIICDYHAHLVSKAGSVIGGKSPLQVFKCG